MVTLCRLIGKNGICQLSKTNKSQAIRELVSHARQFANKPWADDFYREVMRKEQLQSTGFGKGIAVAHGTCQGIDQVYVALGISQEGIEYDAIDFQPVHLLFLVANPPETQLEYLSALSTLVRLLRNDSFREKIMHCVTAEQVYLLFKRRGCTIPIRA
ncbi:PTS sugar transporter subunit IIA [Sediminispirochaeta bajacaliforniensis]|uniref:PTS sugar transporter subunit IIA n=1 Tax=Sediminispirochaeta bajacaliforniensis TaxID=148 RepID=UPI00036BCDEE|nr:PTS sugar transporter subunit IIA [Sediminispirochaeta bajacaliforniensis]